MRWLKKLLIGIYLYMGIFFGACFAAWLVTGEEPSSLIMGISAAVGVESIAAGAIRIMENKEYQKKKKENEKYEYKMGAEIDQP